MLSPQASLVQRTQLAFLCMRIMGTPCWCLLSMLVFILYKYVHLTPLQMTVIIALKPTSSLLSPYWSQAIYQRPDNIVSNLLWANFFRYLPLLFLPWIHSVWFIIFAFGLYMTLSRATIPAWMEMFKYNLPQAKREQLVAHGTIIDYLGTAILTVGAGIVLDHCAGSWRWLFCLTAILGIFSSFVLSSMTTFHAPLGRISGATGFNLQEKIIRPWKQVLDLIRHRPDFLRFQIGFMLGGAGLMIMQPALPQFFIDTLDLSFVEMGLAISLCKGVGVALSSTLWTKLFRQLNIFHLSALVTFFATLFPFLLLTTSWHLVLLYIAYAFYGVMQAGSELSWHMSGLVFAQDKDSSVFSATNVLTVGIRGCIIPAIGAMLLPVLHPMGIILFGALLCLMASGFFLLTSRRSTCKSTK